jgi:chromosome segregation ATPase
MSAVFGLDPEISNIHDQIERVERDLISLQSDIKQISVQYESELERLQVELDKKKIDVETKLSALNQEQLAIEKALTEDQALEIEQLQERLDETLRQQERFAKRRSEITRVKKEAEIAALRGQVERRKIKREADDFTSQTVSQQQKMERQEREAHLQAQIEILDSEINEISASRNDELQRARVMIDEAASGFTNRKRERLANLEQLDDEIAKRTKQYADQFAAIEEQQKLELEELDTESKATNERLQGLQQLFGKMEKRNNREIQITERDIEKLSEAIRQAQSREAEQLEEAQEQITRLEEAKQDNVAIEQELLALRDEIAQIRKDNQDMRKERQRLDTVIYSSRISKHRTGLR